jgi:catechol 2,3-dioxygenase-like lactoylglutathione lyase family enzyme
MPLTELNHFFVRASDLEETRRFYVEALGFEVLPRPPLPFFGYWLGVNGTPQIHMGPAQVENQELFYVGTPPDAVSGQSGVIDHVAFLATDPTGMRQRLDALGISYRPRSFPEAKLFQLFVDDPNGITIELNFFGIDTAPWS